jgi:membrane fusion protein, adhesin transport system
VRDGDLVSVGDVLLRLEETARMAELDQVRARATSLRIREIRLRALLDNSQPNFGDLALQFPEQVASAMFALEATRNRVEGQRAVIESRIRQRKKSVDIFLRQTTSLEDQMALIQETVDMRDDLFEAGHGSKVNLISAKLELSRVNGALTESIVSADQARAAIQESENEIAELEFVERSQALEELSQVIADLAEVEQNSARLRDRVDRLVIAATGSGIIHGLSVNTTGAVIAPGQVLLTIVPIDGDVVASVRIDPKDIGHVAIGQTVKMNISGFDARRYGTILGKLTRVSPTSDSADDGTTYFEGRIVLDRSEITGLDSTHQITPGMVIQADMITGSQTLLQYLTGPLYVAVNAAFSER